MSCMQVVIPYTSSCSLFLLPPAFSPLPPSFPYLHHLPSPFPPNTHPLGTVTGSCQAVPSVPPRLHQALHTPLTPSHPSPTPPGTSLGYGFPTSSTSSLDGGDKGDKEKAAAGAAAGASA